MQKNYQITCSREAEVDSRISRRVAIVPGGGPSATKQFRKAFCCSKWRWHCPAQQGCNYTSIYTLLMQRLIMSVLCFVILWPVCILLYIWPGMGRGNQVMNQSDRLMSSYRDCGVGGSPATTHKLCCIFIWCGSCQQQHSWQQGVRRSFFMCSEFFLVECRKIIGLHAAEKQRWIVEFQDAWRLWQAGGPSATKQFRKAFCCSKWRWHCPAQQGCIFG